MILISHRGNITGPNEKRENSISYIEEALELGFDVEIDIWVDKQLWLGHDNPETPCPTKFLIQNFRHLWIHCKNLEAMDLLSQFRTLNYFWHEKDKIVLTN